MKSGVGVSREADWASTVIVPADVTWFALLIAARTSLSTVFSANATAIDRLRALLPAAMATATDAAPVNVSMRDESIAVTAMLPALMPVPLPSIEPSTSTLMVLMVSAPAPLRPIALLPIEMAADNADTDASMVWSVVAATVKAPAAETLVFSR